MGRGIRLIHEHLNQIDLLRLKTTSTDVFRNCLIIIMAHFGATIAQIAERFVGGTCQAIPSRCPSRASNDTSPAASLNDQASSQPQ
jgi:hypothetical protein